MLMLLIKKGLNFFKPFSLTVGKSTSTFLSCSVDPDEMIVGQHLILYHARYGRDIGSHLQQVMEWRNAAMHHSGWASGLRDKKAWPRHCGQA
ncbi:hypothetical protein [Alteromonas halophila]|uniref:hypothetical protein n=1 Tax=Alteromonas halophila TaxID=516698 RepID=UPI001673F8AC|nr:hypothetical protein [Alteromonas halophila]